MCMRCKAAEFRRQWEAAQKAKAEQEQAKLRCCSAAMFQQRDDNQEAIEEVRLWLHSEAGIIAEESQSGTLYVRVPFRDGRLLELTTEKTLELPRNDERPEPERPA